jgi:uncharacterized protein (TIGR03437 family)
VNETVNQGASTINLSATPNPSTPGTSVTFTAAVPASATGTIAFLIDGSQVAVQTVSNGQAEYSTSDLSIGTHVASADYGGDSNFKAATSAPISEIIQTPPAALSLVLTSSTNPSTVGQAVTFSVAPSYPIANLPGVVIFYDGSAPIGTSPVSNNTATFTTSALAAGSHIIVAKYVLGVASLQTSIGQVVNGLPSTTTVTPSSSTPQVGVPLLVSVQIGPAPPTGVHSPSGTVQYQDNGVPVGTSQVASGRSAFTFDSLTAGTHQITAIYSGDNSWSSSFGRTTVTVTPPPLKVTSAATATATNFSPDEVASVFSVTVLRGSDTPATTTPLPTTLDNTTVSVRDSAGVSRLAPLYGVFVSASQINFIIPSGTAAGPATLTITGPAGVLTANINVAPIAPAIFTANMNGQGVYAGQVVHGHTDGTQTITSSATFDTTQNTWVPVPVSLDPSTDQVFLVLYGTGIRHFTTGVTATVNGVSVTAEAAAQGTYAGLDQVNLQLPSNLAGAGSVNIVITVDGQPANIVTATIQ